MFKPYIFNVIIVMVSFKSIILLFIFYLSILFFVGHSLLLPDSQFLCFFDTVLVSFFFSFPGKKKT